MTPSHTWLSPATDYDMTAVDVEAEKRRRSRMWTRSHLASITHSILALTSRTRANRDTISSFAASWGIALISYTTLV